MIRSLGDLCDYVGVEVQDLPNALQAEKDFPVRVTRSFADRIEKGKPQDPLLLQVLPLAQEVIEVQGFTEDPLEEKQANPVPGLIHKYAGRVLLISNPSCAIHCRYCFRRHFPYDENTPGSQQFAPIIDYLQQDSSIHEVILSGGDPLMSNDKQLAGLINAIAGISHIETLRIHTRLPVVLPERITDDLVKVLASTRLKVVMVIHSNHANELDDTVGFGLGRLWQAGIRLLNQSVLLKGVNEHLDDQLALLRRLHKLDVQPYYLHVLDRTKGTAHFLVEDQEAVQLHNNILGKLSGYLVPKLVREVAHHKNKSLIS